MTPLSIWNTRLFPPPLIVNPAAGPVIVCIPLASLSASSLPPRVTVCGVPNTVGSKSIVFACALPLAVAIAAASEPLPEAFVFVTVIVASSWRSSSVRTAGRSRHRPRRLFRGVHDDHATRRFCRFSWLMMGSLLKRDLGSIARWKAALNRRSARRRLLTCVPPLRRGR